MSKQFITLFITALLGAGAQAVAEPYDIYATKRAATSVAMPDTVLNYAPSSRWTDEPANPTLIDKLVEYIASANKPRPAKKFDFSLIAGPYYASDTKLGIGVVAAGLYRHNMADTINPAGQVNIYGDVSITGYYKIGIRGTQYFNNQALWLNYNTSFESAPDKFWGIGYAMASNRANESSYKRWHANLDAELLCRLHDKLYLGPRLLIDYLSARDVERPALWDGQNLHSFSGGLGLAMVYDSRDNVFNAFKGWYLRFDQMFAPKFIGNKMAFSFTELTLNHYQQLWRGAVLASRLHTRMSYGNTPWGLMSKFGGGSTMRGYWEGRYNDKCSADVTVELRQHVWSRSGVVVWGGLGEVFGKPRELFRGHALWNFGFGYRWEFKKRVNVRVDYGFGRGESGLVFSINEAF